MEEEKGVEDQCLLPEHRSRFFVRRALAAALLTACAGLAAAYGSVKVIEAFLGVLALCAFLRALERFHRGRQLLLRWALIPRRDPAVAIASVGALIPHARFDPRLHACFVASVAELELKRGDVERGYRLFAGLRERGWSPRSLIAGVTLWASASARTVATMATVEALEGDPEHAAAAIPHLARHGGAGLALLPSVVLGLRRGEPHKVLAGIAEHLREHGELPVADRCALAYLYELAAASSGVLPFRGAALKRVFEAPGGAAARALEQRWLVMRRPYLCLPEE